MSLERTRIEIPWPHGKAHLLWTENWRKRKEIQRPKASPGWYSLSVTLPGGRRVRRSTNETDPDKAQAVAATLLRELKKELQPADKVKPSEEEMRQWSREIEWPLGKAHLRWNPEHGSYLMEVAIRGGKRIRQSTGESNLTLAIQKIEALLRQIEHRLLVDEQEKFGELMDDFLESNKEDFSAATQRLYLRFREQTFGPLWGHLPVSEITPELITTFQHDRPKAASELKFIKACLRYGRKRDVQRSSPHPSRLTISPELLEREHLNKLPIHLRLFCLCGLHCGGTRTQWTRLNWNGVDFENKTITLPATIGISKKVRPMTPRVEEELRALKEVRNLQVQLEEGYEAGSEEYESRVDREAVFQYQGKRLSELKTSWRDGKNSSAKLQTLFFEKL